MLAMAVKACPSFTATGIFNVPFTSRTRSRYICSTWALPISGSVGM